MSSWAQVIALDDGRYTKSSQKKAGKETRRKASNINVGIKNVGK